MKFLIILSLLISFVCAQTPLFPYPSSVTWGNTNISISPSSFSITSSSSSTLLQQAIKRYQGLIFPFSTTSTDSKLPSLVISVSSDDEDLQLGVDESYTLTVGETTNSLTANSIFGAMRGLETFSQLVVWDLYSETYSVNFSPVTIKDAPRFEWRGLMIDTARHFLPVSTIYRAIDAASYNKMNTLHWHAIDAESFPIQTTSFPRLSQFGAYAPSAVYSHSDIQNIVNYGLERGVRVVIEFDIPGHSYSWGKGYPNVTTNCPNMAVNINNVALDPSNPFTFEVLTGFLSEIIPLFSDNTIHLGGDEVEFGCWLENQEILNWMKKMGFQNGPDVEQYFETQLATIVAKLNKTMVCWQELFNNGIVLKENTIVEVWQDAGTLQEVVEGGYRGLVAFPYYLDKQIPKPGSTHYEWVDTWHDFYASDPYDNITTGQENIIGGEAIMFAEQVDSVNFDARVWPRASGVAERLWSAQSVNDITSAIPRLVAFRCRMAQRGIAAGPIAPDYCPLPGN